MLEREARVPGAEDGTIRDRLVEQLPVVRLRRGIALQQQVGVGVDEPRQDGQRRQVDDLRTPRLARELRQRPDPRDPLSLDEDPDVRLRRVRSTVDEAPGLDEDGRGRSRSGSRGLAGEHQGKEADGEAQGEGTHFSPPVKREANLPLTTVLSSGLS